MAFFDGLFLFHQNSLPRIRLNQHRLLPAQSFKFKGCSLMRSCHGLLCFNNEDEEILIFNPSIQKGKRILPFVPFKFDYYERTVPDGAIVRDAGYGFGYDAVSDYYKIVWLLSLTRIIVFWL